MIDTHCHLTDHRFEGGVNAVIERARIAGVSNILCAASNVEDSERAALIASQFPDVYCSAGVHPHDSSKVEDGYLAKIESLNKSSRCVALGEIGLDYHYDFSPPAVQQECFARQLEIALRLDATVIVHTREAFDDTISILDESGIDMTRVIFHSFTGGRDEARVVIDKGASISFSGIVTFKNAAATREAAAMVPEDKILAETDSPYLSPEPIRNVRPNEPAHVIHVARRLAEIRNISLDEMAPILSCNAKRILGLQSDG